MDSKGVAHVLLWIAHHCWEVKKPKTLRPCIQNHQRLKTAIETWGVWGALLKADAVPSAEDISQSHAKSLLYRTTSHKLSLLMQSSTCGTKLVHYLLQHHPTPSNIRPATLTAHLSSPRICTSVHDWLLLASHCWVLVLNCSPESISKLCGNTPTTEWVNWMKEELLTLEQWGQQKFPWASFSGLKPIYSATFQSQYLRRKIYPKG